MKQLTISTKNTEYGTKTTIQHPDGILPMNVVIDQESQTHLSLGYGKPGHAESGFGCVSLDKSMGLVKADTYPEGVYLAKLATGTDGSVYVFGSFEKQDKEYDVYFPLWDSLPEALLKPVNCTQEDILGVTKGWLVRHCFNSSKKNTTSIIFDSINGKSKQKIIKLDIDQKSSKAILQEDRTVCVLRSKRDLTCVILNSEGAELERFPLIIGQEGGYGGFVPIGAGETSVDLVTGHKDKLGLLKSNSKTQSQWIEIATLPIPTATAYLIWGARRSDSRICTQFTFGADAPAVSGNGWVLIENDQSPAHWMSVGGGSYRDHLGNEHKILEGDGILSSIDLGRDFVVSCYHKKCEGRPNEIVVLKHNLA